VRLQGLCIAALPAEDVGPHDVGLGEPLLEVAELLVDLGVDVPGYASWRSGRRRRAPPRRRRRPAGPRIDPDERDRLLGGRVVLRRDGGDGVPDVPDAVEASTSSSYRAGLTPYGTSDVLPGDDGVDPGSLSASAVSTDRTRACG
jgi:hypothetical protein